MSINSKELLYSQGSNAKSANCVDEMLKSLIIHHMNELDKEAQKISFVFGNCDIENDNITLETVKEINEEDELEEGDLK